MAALRNHRNNDYGFDKSRDKYCHSIGYSQQYHFVQVLDVVEQIVGIKEDENSKNKPRNTNALKSAILKWNENGANLTEMAINGHLS